MRHASNSASHSENQSSTSPGQKDGSLADTLEMVKAGVTEGTGATVGEATEGGEVEEGIEASEVVVMVRFVVGRQLLYRSVNVQYQVMRIKCSYCYVYLRVACAAADAKLKAHMTPWSVADKEKGSWLPCQPRPTCNDADSAGTAPDSTRRKRGKRRQGQRQAATDAPPSFQRRKKAIEYM